MICVPRPNRRDVKPLRPPGDYLISIAFDFSTSGRANRLGEPFDELTVRDRGSAGTPRPTHGQSGCDSPFSKLRWYYSGVASM
jgi:hypothetical protein